MKIATCVVLMLLLVSPAYASITSLPDQPHSFQSLFDRVGYGYVDVSKYQTDLNLDFQGQIDVQLVYENGILADAGFGVATYGGANKSPTDFTMHNVFGMGEKPAVNSRSVQVNDRSHLGFYLYQQGRYGSILFGPGAQGHRASLFRSFFFEDPLHENTYFLAWRKLNIRSPLSQNNTDEMLLKITLRPAPEPATWLLLLCGLIGVGIIVRFRRQQAVS